MSVVTLSNPRSDSSEFNNSVIVNCGLSQPNMEVISSVVNLTAASPGNILSHILVKEECKSPNVLKVETVPSSSPRGSPSSMVKPASRDVENSVIVQNSFDSEKSLQTAYDGHSFPNEHYENVMGFSGMHHAAPDPLTSVDSPVESTESVYALGAEDGYYREYYDSTNPDHYLNLRHLHYKYENHMEGSYMDRYIRPSTLYKVGASGLTVDLPSPDSGIGVEALTPREHSLSQNVDYQELVPASNSNQHNLLDSDGNMLLTSGDDQLNVSLSTRSRSWHELNRQSESDKKIIPKVYSSFGFRYFLEASISTSQRREDDRITYINKGQFYPITLEFVPNPEKPPLKSLVVKSIISLMFREEKEPEDEIKAWQFWHSRQHSVKQRILDVDMKNSYNLVGCIEEIAHNAIAVYWNPTESTSKGLPLHIQIDTYQDPRDSVVYHRGYCQIKVFCDKGAERKTRDEERRTAKRRLTITGRKKMEELYHSPCDRSEFYSMSDLLKPSVLFTPSTDVDKLPQIDLGSYYSSGEETSRIINPGIDRNELTVNSLNATPLNNLLSTPVKGINGAYTLKFHNIFPSSILGDKRFSNDSGCNGSAQFDASYLFPTSKRSKSLYSTDRLMLFVRQEKESSYTPLHLVPPSTVGLLKALEVKYQISPSSVKSVYRKNQKGIIAKVDDDMLRHYCNEDIFLIDIKRVDGSDCHEITLTELPYP